MALVPLLSGIAGKAAFGRKCSLRDKTEAKKQIKNININLVLLGPVFKQCTVQCGAVSVSVTEVLLSCCVGHERNLLVGFRWESLSHQTLPQQQLLSQSIDLSAEALHQQPLPSPGTVPLLWECEGTGMEWSSVFRDDLQPVPVSWRAQGSSWLFCSSGLCLSPGAFQGPLCLCPECSVLGCSPGQGEMFDYKSGRGWGGHPAEGSVPLQALGHQDNFGAAL